MLAASWAQGFRFGADPRFQPLILPRRACCTCHHLRALSIKLRSCNPPYIAMRKSFYDLPRFLLKAFKTHAIFNVIHKEGFAEHPHFCPHEYR